MPPMIVDVEGVQELIARGAQLVEVLPKHEYRQLHLPRAMNLPLSELDARSAQRLDRGRPVVVYCWDALCDLSPRAAARLDQLGFEAYDYALSKVDWMARGLPVEGSSATEPTALSLLREDVPTCALNDDVATLRARIDASPFGFALALRDRTVMGRVRRTRLDEAADSATAETVMEPAPSTVRPHIPLDELERRFQNGGAQTLILTTPAAELIGVVRRADLPGHGEEDRRAGSGLAAPSRWRSSQALS
jgi:rhodanese-related sulfurtransferase